MARTPLAELLRAGRDRRHWTQEDLARESGIGRDEIAGIEAGRIASPPPTTLQPIAKALRIPVRDIVTALGWTLEDAVDAEAIREHAALDVIQDAIDRLRRHRLSGEQTQG